MGQDERGKAMMTKEQIITSIIDCLDHQLNGGMGHMQDKYYKGEFFICLPRHIIMGSLQTNRSQAAPYGI